MVGAWWPVAREAAREDRGDAACPACVLTCPEVGKPVEVVRREIDVGWLVAGLLAGIVVGVIIGAALGHVWRRPGPSATFSRRRGGGILVDAGAW